MNATRGGFICKQCHGPSPLGVGYAAPGADAEAASQGLTRCACGYSVEKGLHTMDDSPIVVDLGAPSARLDGAHQLAVHHQLGVHPQAAGAEGWVDIVTVDPTGDVLSLLTPEAARRLAAALYEAADRLEASGR